MSLRLSRVWKSEPLAGARPPFLQGVDFSMEAGAHVGVLGPSKSENTALLRLMCGTEFADSGKIERPERISWPVPQAGIFISTSTLAMNIRFVARLYGIRDDHFPRRVIEMVQLMEFANRPLKDCPGSVKQRLALALAIGMDFDIYLFDGSLTPVDKEFKKSAAEIVASAMAPRGFVLASKTPGEIEQNCESVYVLADGQLRFFAQTAEGVQYFKNLEAERKERESPGQADADEDADSIGSDDVDMIGVAVGSAVE